MPKFNGMLRVPCGACNGSGRAPMRSWKTRATLAGVVHDFGDGTLLQHASHHPDRMTSSIDGFEMQATRGCWYCAEDEARRYKERRDVSGLRRYLMDEEREAEWAWRVVIESVPP